MNVRYFTLDDGTWWFGGGIDLTPHYVVAEEARAFHADLKAVCDRHAVADYAASRRGQTGISTARTGGIPWGGRHFL